MKILLFDTETNGLPKNKYAPPSQTDAFPAVLQLSWAVFTISDKSLTAGPVHVFRGHESHLHDVTLALGPDVIWDSGAAAIHGISEEEARRGQDPATVLLAFRDILAQVDCVVAHNLGFDKPVIRAAAYAASMKEGLSPLNASLLRNLWPIRVQEFCTMTTTRNLVRAPWPVPSTNDKYPFKPPRLNELYTWLHGHVYDLSGSGNVLHTARTDTHCLARCVLAMLRKGIITVAENRLVTA
jgi:DNA polymerase III epsilon subunit-like protein